MIQMGYWLHYSDKRYFDQINNKKLKILIPGGGNSYEQNIYTISFIYTIHLIMRKLR